MRGCLEGVTNVDDELSRKLDALLNSPDGMEKLRSTAAALGLSGLTGEEKPPQPEDTAAALPNLMNLMPLLGSLGNDDQNTALLKALRPYLHNGREKRLDESIKLLQLIKLLPLLQGGLGL